MGGEVFPSPPPKGWAGKGGEGRGAGGQKGKSPKWLVKLCRRMLSACTLTCPMWPVGRGWPVWLPRRRRRSGQSACVNPPLCVYLRLCVCKFVCAEIHVSNIDTTRVFVCLCIHAYMCNYVHMYACYDRRLGCQMAVGVCVLPE